METLKEAKEYLKENHKKGTRCPCCDQFVKLYKRKITSAMAYGLILLLREEAIWIHLEDFFKNKKNLPSSIRGDISKLRFWGFLAKYEGEKEDGNPRNGMATVTHKGLHFALGKISAPKNLFIYNNKVYSRSVEECSIQECLGDRFNYNELMES